MIDASEVIKERAKIHGNFTEGAGYMQRLKAVINASNAELTSVQREGLEMIAHKIGRILAGDPNHTDHWLDIEGYARLVRERL